MCTERVHLKMFSVMSLDLIKISKISSWTPFVHTHKIRSGGLKHRPLRHSIITPIKHVDLIRAVGLNIMQLFIYLRIRTK